MITKFFYSSNILDILKFITIYLYELGKNRRITVPELLEEFKNKIFEITESDRYSEYFIERFSDFIRSKINFRSYQEPNCSIYSDNSDLRIPNDPHAHVYELIEFINKLRDSTLVPGFKIFLSNLSEFIQEKFDSDEVVTQALFYSIVPEAIKNSIRLASFNVAMGAYGNQHTYLFHKEFIKDLKTQSDFRIRYIANEFLVWCNLKKELNISYEETEPSNNMFEEPSIFAGPSIPSPIDSQIENNISFEQELIREFIDKINPQIQNEITHSEFKNYNENYHKLKKIFDKENCNKSQGFDLDMEVI